MHLTEGENVHNRSCCTAPAMVLLHGWCMSSAVWRCQMDQYAAHWRVIAPDFNGHGDSPAAGENSSFEGFAAEIAALFERTRIDNALLVGWSLGGQVAIQSSAALRGRLRGLVLVATTPCFLARPDFPYGLSDAELRGMEVKVRRDVTRAVTGFRQRMFVPDEIAEASRAQHVSALLDEVPIPDTATALAGLTMLAHGDMRGMLANIDMPTLIIGGSRDVICPPDASRYLAEHIPDAELEIYEGCGHAPFLSFPERFNNSINQFARKVFGTHA